MSGLDKIINDITLEAEADAEKVKADARKKAEKIISRAREKEAEILSTAEQSAVVEGKKAAMRADAAARTNEKRMMLKEKQQIIDEVLDAAKHEIAQYSNEKYFDFMLKLVEKYAEEEQGEIIVSESAKKNITSEFRDAISKKGLVLSDRTGDFEIGFILVYGDIEENCTLDALMESEHDRLHDVISEFLFG